MTIIVTGAAGLIGSHLCDLLFENGNHVIGIDDLSFGNINNINKKIEFHKIDLSKENSLINFKNIDVICHLASYKKSFVAETSSFDVMDINFGMSKEVIRFCKNSNTKLLFTSTSDIYGNSKNFLENEQITLGPPTVQRYSYALSKLHTEQLILNEVDDKRICAVIARIFGCASPRSSKSWSGGHIPMFIDRALSNKDILIHGDGLQTRSISHALDIANGLKSMSMKINELNGNIINIGTDEQMSVIKSAEIIIKLTGSNSKIIFQDSEKIFKGYDEIRKRFANTSKAKTLLNYKVNYKSIDVIKEIISEFKK
ncbi:NAD-dependent epimerase/dehydratase family protein [Flavobacteriaceae bacterium]|nr:NAD-dependent epimerase/dehydratase family protein [Flavobacteriaceae bacterium]